MLFTNGLLLQLFCKLSQQPIYTIHLHWINPYNVVESQVTIDLFPLLSVLQSTKDVFLCESYNTGAICVTGTANPSGASEFTPGSM